MSTDVTRPASPTRDLRRAALYPVPAPISRTFCPGESRRASSIRPMMIGADDELIAMPRLSFAVANANSGR